MKMATATLPAFEKEAPPFRVEPDGTVRIGQSRITLDFVVEAFLLGKSPEVFVQQYNSVSLADVYSTIAYYLAHQSALEPYLRSRSQHADDMLSKIKSDPRNQGLREQLLNRAKERGIKT